MGVEGQMDRWKIGLVKYFIIVSIFFYSLHFFIFRDGVYIFKFIIAQLGFLPISALLVSLVINQLMTRREKQEKSRKMNMVIGAFFSEVGTKLVEEFSIYDKNPSMLNDIFHSFKDWEEEDFHRTRNYMDQYDLEMDSSIGDFLKLKELLENNRGFLLNLLQNANQLHHQKFTDLIWAVLHVGEEIEMGDSVGDLDDERINHLSNDIKRAYKLIIIAWIDYLLHLKKEYPFLYSLAIRKNPYNKSIILP